MLKNCQKNLPTMHLAYVESALHKILGQPPDQRTLTIGGRINLQLVSGFTGVGGFYPTRNHGICMC